VSGRPGSGNAELELRRQLGVTLEHCAALERERAALEEATASLRADERALLGRRLGLEEDCQRLAEELEDSETRAAHLDGQITKLRQAMATLHLTVDGDRRAGRRLHVERGQLERELLELRDQIGAMEKRMAGLSGSVMRIDYKAHHGLRAGLGDGLGDRPGDGLGGRQGGSR